jgi:hypothetical protein
MMAEKKSEPMWRTFTVVSGALFALGIVWCVVKLATNTAEDVLSFGPIMCIGGGALFTTALLGGLLTRTELSTPLRALALAVNFLATCFLLWLIINAIWP